jgi:hypothetical protein
MANIIKSEYSIHLWSLLYERHTRHLVMYRWCARHFNIQANYTDWSTAASRRILVLTFANRGVSRCQRGGTSTAVNLVFLLFLSSSSSLIFKRLSGLRTRPSTTKKTWRRRGSNPGLLRLWPGAVTTRPQRRSTWTHSSHKWQEDRPKC